VNAFLFGVASAAANWPGLTNPFFSGEAGLPVPENAFSGTGLITGIKVTARDKKNYAKYAAQMPQSGLKVQLKRTVWYFHTEKPCNVTQRHRQRRFFKVS